ncbi:MAG TPA: helix-turn-helix domain-containing protein [Anaerolineales bacterium]|nr:helix-turn-helix domain-containing protein [Anaerolineales bacterium]
MKRKEFGELIATLRQDLGWTQFQFAEYAEVDEAVVSQIERGVKKYFEPDLLFRLANALQLTTLERREFFLAASGLDDTQLVRQLSAQTATDVFNGRKLLDKLVNLLGQMQFPAFLTDVYSDVIAANNSILAFFKIPATMIENADHIPGGYNSMRLIFGRELVGRTHVADNWDHYALDTIRTFRETSLRYRAKPYFKYLMKTFRNQTEYPFFERYWRITSSTEEDKEINMDSFHYHHNEFDNLKYISTSTISMTSFGELFLNQYLPLDAHTGQVFGQLLRETGEGAVRLAPWPVKPMP